MMRQIILDIVTGAAAAGIGVGTLASVLGHNPFSAVLKWWVGRAIVVAGAALGAYYHAWQYVPAW